MAAAVWTATAPHVHAQSPAGHSPRTYKDGEYDIVNQAYNDVGDPAKELADLDNWARKFSDSDYKNDRLYLYVQAYLKLNQPDKVLEYGSQFLSQDVNAVFAGPGTEQVAGLPVKLTMLNVLYSVAYAASLPTTSSAHRALGEKAAKQLLQFAPRYFTPENKPATQSDAAWSAAGSDVAGKARAVLLALALKPGIEAQWKKDCPGQEAAFSKALAAYPESGAALYQMGVTYLSCEGAVPEKVSLGLWQIARAASLNPATSGLDAKDLPDIQTYLKKVYTRIHGSDDGLEQLTKQASASPVPPAGFRIRSMDEIAREKQAEFERGNPQLALWMKIRSQLVDTNGDQYFQGQMKDAAVPQLWGAVVEARPACHPKELLVAVPLPDGQKPYKAEILLKLDRPLGGMPEQDAEFHWEGIPSAFSREPFLLTMDTESAKVSGLKMTPCTSAPVRSGVKKGTGIENEK